MRTRQLTPVLAVTLLAVLALFPSGCAARVPDTDPSIRGRIVSVLPADELGSIAVEADAPPAFEYDRASVRITGDTTLLRETGNGDTEPIGFADLAQGDEVDVWFEGAVAESYPVQATAGLVLVRQ